MTANEMRELDAWIAENVMGREVDLTNEHLINRYKDGGKSVERLPQYTLDPAAAMMVLEKCLEKTEADDLSYIGKVGDEFIVGHEPLKNETIADTLLLAICLFAKKLFEKKGTK